MTDPIADMLTRIRNAITARHANVIDAALEAEGAHRRGPQGRGLHRRRVVTRRTTSRALLTIVLRYGHNNHNAIDGIRRVSRPVSARYARHDRSPRVRSGLGISILTTSNGVMTDREARKQGLGGELLCEVW